jgi:hypothetical protein
MDSKTFSPLSDACAKLLTDKMVGSYRLYINFVLQNYVSPADTVFISGHIIFIINFTDLRPFQYDKRKLAALEIEK